MDDAENTPAVITRNEICELLDIYRSKLVDIIRYQPELGFPGHCLPARRELTYDTAAVLAWAAAHDVQAIRYVNANSNPFRIPTPTRAVLQTDLVLGFLSGAYDSPERKLKHRKKRLTAHHVPPRRRGRVTTEESGFIKATSHWAGLV